MHAWQYAHEAEVLHATLPVSGCLSFVLLENARLHVLDEVHHLANFVADGTVAHGSAQLQRIVAITLYFVDATVKQRPAEDYEADLSRGVDAQE